MKDTDLIRVSVLEERMNNMCKQNNLDHSEILKKIEEIDHKLDVVFVTKTEFDPVKRIVFGLVGIVLTALAGALVKLIFSYYYNRS
jgi:predicted ATP-grasp superfamily ATP-dependent carboligase